MGKAVPMASFRRATRPTESAVAAFVELGDAPGDTPAPVTTGPDSSNEVEDPKSVSTLHIVSDEKKSRTPEQPLDANPAVARQPAKWRRKTVLRTDGRELRKQTIYLDAELSHRLMVTCAEDQYELSEAIEEAVNFWLKQRG